MVVFCPKSVPLEQSKEVLSSIDEDSSSEASANQSEEEQKIVKKKSVHACRASSSSSCSEESYKSPESQEEMKGDLADNQRDQNPIEFVENARQGPEIVPAEEVEALPGQFIRRISDQLLRPRARSAEVQERAMPIIQDPVESEEAPQELNETFI